MGSPRRRAAPPLLVVLALLSLAACQGTGLPVSGAEPKYEPGAWDPGPMPDDILFGDREKKITWLMDTAAGRAWFRLYRIKLNSNCYNYACNRMNAPPAGDNDAELPPPAEPGRAGGYKPPNGWCRLDKNGKESATTADDPARSLCAADMTCTNLIAASLSDGMTAIDCGKKCDADSYKKALVLNPLDAAEKADALPDGNQTDLHWYRQNPDGTWSHKRGQQPATDKAPGKPDGTGGGGKIADPRAAEARGPYTEFCGCFCCGPKVKKASGDERRGQLATLLAQPATTATTNGSGLQVIASIHSGRRNPRWTITDAATMAELARRTNLQALVPVPDPGWPILGPNGFSIETEDPRVLDTGLIVPGLAIFRGAIRIGDRYYRDDLGLEAWIEANWPGGAPGRP